MDSIVREFCLDPEIDVVARLQQRFLEGSVAKTSDR